MSQLLQIRREIPLNEPKYVIEYAWKDMHIQMVTAVAELLEACADDQYAVIQFKKNLTPRIMSNGLPGTTVLQISCSVDLVQYRTVVIDRAHMDALLPMRTIPQAIGDLALVVEYTLRRAIRKLKSKISNLKS